MHLNLVEFDFQPWIFEIKKKKNRGWIKLKPDTFLKSNHINAWKMRILDNGHS